MDRVSELRRIRVFADLREAELQWLADHAEFRDLEAGEAAVVEGTPASYMLAVIDGELRGRREKAAFDGVVIVVRAGDVSGMLPFSRMQTFPVTSRAMVPTRLAIFPASLFPEMLERVPVLEPRLIAVLADRVRRTTRDAQHRDALMALGKLAAGLAHEVNNPAAAAQRSAGLLRQRLGDLCAGAAALARRGVGEDGFRAR